jgi:hypothetical protein
VEVVPSSYILVYSSQRRSYEATNISSYQSWYVKAFRMLNLLASQLYVLLYVQAHPSMDRGMDDVVLSQCTLELLLLYYLSTVTYTNCRSKSLDNVALALGALTAGGGITGYVRTGSVPSVAAGVTVGILVCQELQLLDSDSSS